MGEPCLQKKSRSRMPWKPPDTTLSHEKEGEEEREGKMEIKDGKKKKERRRKYTGIARNSKKPLFFDAGVIDDGTAFLQRNGDISRNHFQMRIQWYAVHGFVLERIIFVLRKKYE